MNKCHAGDVFAIVCMHITYEGESTRFRMPFNIFILYSESTNGEHSMNILYDFIHSGFRVMFNVHVKHIQYWLSLFEIFTLSSHFERANERTNKRTNERICCCCALCRRATCVAFTVSHALTSYTHATVRARASPYAWVCVCCAFAFKRSMWRDILSLLSIVYHNC